MLTTNKINKPPYLKGKTIKLKLVEESDAEFILSLRLDDRYNKYLSKVDNDILKQRLWIREYKESEKRGEQYYFIIQRHNNKPCGTVRVYDFQADSFSWGSWILNENKTRYAAIETAMLIYKFGFEILGFEKSHFEVIKKNSSVTDFHRKLGASISNEDNENYYFNFIRETYIEKLVTFSKYCNLPKNNNL